MSLRRPSARARGELLAPAASLLVCVVASLPTLLHAERLHSDAAVVGLQALHLLRGEASSWFLWGSGYQTSFDSWVAAAFFRVFGPSPTALMASAFVGYLALAAFVYATLRRRFGPWSAALLVTPLLFIAGPARIHAFYPPRQGALTLVFASVFVTDGAPGRRWPTAHLVLGAFLSGLACVADPYCLVFLPGVLVLLALTAPENDARLRGARPALASACGLAAGLVPLWMLSHGPGAAHGVYGFTAASISRNARILVDACLPFLLGTKVVLPSLSWDEAFWHPPAWFHAIQLIGAASLASGVALGALLSLRRGLALHERRLGAFGGLMVPVTLAAFLLSVMVVDRLSARYLVAILLVSPFALAPLLGRVGPRWLALGLAPYLLSVIVGGWVTSGSSARDMRAGLAPGIGRDEQALSDFLRVRGIEAGVADYWVSYRLTFLLRERAIIVPDHPELDRYAPYRRVVGAAHRVAYVYDPTWSKESLPVREVQFAEGTRDFEPGFEEARVGRYTVLLLTPKVRSGLRLAGASVASRPSTPGVSVR